jgi:hypothetical protein
VYRDSTGKPIKVKDRVRFRGKEYTIKDFDPGLGVNNTSRIIFEEKQDTLEWADEISVDLVTSAELPKEPPLVTNFGKVDTRPQKGAWAPGSYARRCGGCEEMFVGDKRALNCADCAYKPDRAVLNPPLGVVTIDNVALPVLADEDFTSTEWDKILNYYPEYVKVCDRIGVKPMDTLGYVLGFCRKLEEAQIERDGHPRTAEGWFWRIADHFGRGWFDEKVLGECAKYFKGF